MRHLVSTLEQKLEVFLDQRDKRVLVVPSDPNGAALLVQLLAQQEDRRGTDIHLNFVHPFEHPASYVDRVISELQQQHRATDATLQQAGKPPLPPFLASLLTSTQLPALRLRDAIHFSRTLLPLQQGHRVIWCFCPLKIADDRLWTRFIDETLFPQAGALQWGGVLVAVRESLSGTMAAALGTRAMVQVHHLDFGQDAIEASLQHDVSDPMLSPLERAQTALMVGCRAMGKGQYRDAIAWVDEALRYARQTQNAALEGLAMTTRGDIERLQGQTVKAQRWYEGALEPAMQAQDIVLLRILASHLGELALLTGDPERGLEYFFQASRLSNVTRDIHAKLHALEHLGECQKRCQKPKDAQASLREALEISLALQDVSAKARIDAALEGLPTPPNRSGRRSRTRLRGVHP